MPKLQAPKVKRSDKPKILVINGPNLNLLGMRDPKIYGKLTLETINAELRIRANQKNYVIEFFQSNDEGTLITKIQEAYFDGTCGILINAGAYAHTSVAILDALIIRGYNNRFPWVEVHLSDPKHRESFRHHSYLEAGAIATCSGKQAQSYYDGLRALICHLQR